MNEGRPLTSEEIKSMKIKEGELLREGAEIDNQGRLEATEKQVSRAHEEMENNILYQKMREILPSDEH